MKKIVVSLLALLLITGCSPKKEEKPTEEQQTSVVAGEKDGYSILTPYIASPLRQRYTQGYREIDTVEIGRRLQEKSKEYFAPKTYYVSEGSVITVDRYDELIGRRSDDNPYALNPERGGAPYVSNIYNAEGKVTNTVQINDPLFVHSIYEIDFYKSKDRSKLDGISVAVVLDRFQVVQAGVTHRLSDDELFTVANEMLGVQLLTYLRKIPGLEEMPIMIAFYVQDSVDDNMAGRYLPGAYIGHGYSKDSRDTVSLTRDNEQWVLLSSDKASKDFPQAYSNFLIFKRKISTFMSDENIGVVGQIFVVGGQIQSYNITVNTGSKTQLELYGLTQYLSTALQELDSNEVPVTINVKLFQNTRAVIDYRPGQTATVSFIN